MKRIFGILLAACMFLSGCGTENGNRETETVGRALEQEGETETESETEKETKQVPESQADREENLNAKGPWDFTGEDKTAYDLSWENPCPNI